VIVNSMWDETVLPAGYRFGPRAFSGWACH
jgi:hypothetical protein